MSLQGPSICVLYKVEEETIDHIFLVYSFSLDVWNKLMHCLRLHLPPLPPTVNLFGPLGGAWLLINMTGFYRIYR